MTRARTGPVDGRPRGVDARAVDARAPSGLRPPRSPRTPIVAVGLLYLAGAAAVAVARGTSAFDHGWWLVAYLALVGALAHSVLGAGALRLLGPGRAGGDPPALRRGMLLWNAGVPLVPLGVLTGTPGWIGAGGVLELLALCVLGAAVLGAAPRRGSPRGLAPTAAYLVVVTALAVSVVIGMRLGHALPA